MIPLTTMPPSSDENSPLHYPRRRPVDHGGGGGGLGSYGSPGLPYGPLYHAQQRLVVRGSQRHHGQYTTAAAAAAAAAAPGQEYFVRRAHGQRAEQVPAAPAVDAEDGSGVEEWKDTCWRLLTGGIRPVLLSSYLGLRLAKTVLVTLLLVYYHSAVRRLKIIFLRVKLVAPRV